jgi:cysteine desulfurase
MNIYLDYNATTPLDSEVLDAMLPFFSEKFCNPSSHYSPAYKTKEAIDIVRNEVASSINAQAGRIIFTSCGTESNNLAIQGITAKVIEDTSAPGHIISNNVEHSSVLKIYKQLKKQGWIITLLDVDQKGIINHDSLKSAITENTCLISIMLANNETGAIQDLAGISEIAHQHGIPVHTDAIQGVGKIPVDIEKLKVDLLSISAHKFYGPKGVGALYIKDRIGIQPILFGGGQENSLKPGTENIPGIVGLGNAIKKAVSNLDEYSIKTKKLINRLRQGIIADIPDIRINSTSSEQLPNTLNISFRGVDSISLQSELDEKGIYVGTGAACSSSSPEVSHVLKGMKVPPDAAFSALRFSLGRPTSAKDIDTSLEILIDTVASLRSNTNTDSPCCCDGCC